MAGRPKGKREMTEQQKQMIYDYLSDKHDLIRRTPKGYGINLYDNFSNECGIFTDTPKSIN
jgi:hypothetical protein